MSNSKFCQNMNKLRNSLDLSFTDLANIFHSKGVEISAPTLQRYESGKIKTVPYDNIVLLSEIFGCTPVELVGWSESSAPELTSSEEELLSIFRKLDKPNQMEILYYARMRLGIYEESAKKDAENFG